MSGYFAPAHIAGTAKSRFLPSGELTVKAGSALQLATEQAKVSNGHGAVVGAVPARLNSNAFQHSIHSVELGQKLLDQRKQSSIWVEVRICSGDETRMRRCGTASAALAEINELATDSLFFAVDRTGEVLTRQQLSDRADVESVL